MHLSDHSLRQMDESHVQSLEVEALRGLSLRLPADLKAARDRLNQGPENSARTPSSRLPWERKGGERDGEWWYCRGMIRAAVEGESLVEIAVCRLLHRRLERGPASRAPAGGAAVATISHGREEHCRR